jgi:hypothetical protein
MIWFYAQQVCETFISVSTLPGFCAVWRWTAGAVPLPI